MKNKKKLLKVLLIALGIFATAFSALLALIYIPSQPFERYDYQPTRPDYWPTGGFRMSSAREQGMDATELADMLEFAAAESRDNPEVMIDSITIIRNGYTVLDAYFNPMFPPEHKHVLHSCTKSVISALIGIAIDQGYIESVDTPIITFFDDKKSAMLDARMEEVTIEDLLTMQTGIRSRDSFVYNYSGLYAAYETDDWVAYSLGLPLDAEPGTRFDYSNLSSFLLSAIITSATDMSTLEFVQANLFEPLGIDDIYWEHSPQGINIGFARMWLKPEDMAKFGLLYLQKGYWDGQQVISENWVEMSLEPHAYPKNYVDALDENGKKDTQASQDNWVSLKFLRPFSDGYGYQWWLDRDGSYNALGTSGQYIMVVPQENLVVVVTSSSTGMGVFLPRKLLDNYILPSIKSPEEINAAPEKEAILAKYAKPPQVEENKKDVDPLPNIAFEISGNEYQLAKNKWNLDNIRLDFEQGADSARFSFTAKVHDKATFEVGLDDQFRYTETPIGKFAAKGGWMNSDTFVIDYQLIGYSAPVHFEITFDGNHIRLLESSLTGTYEYDGNTK